MPAVGQDFWTPGSLVKLKEPYKPRTTGPHFMETVATGTRFFTQRMQDVKDYQGFVDACQQTYTEDWGGFSYGIIVQVLPGNRVSLFLYDPSRFLLYTDGPFSAVAVPTYVEFSQDDLFPYKYRDSPWGSVLHE